MPVPGLSDTESKRELLLVKHEDLQDALPARLLISTGKNTFLFVFLSDPDTDWLFVFPQNAYVDQPHQPWHDSVRRWGPWEATRKARSQGRLLHREDPGSTCNPEGPHQNHLDLTLPVTQLQETNFCCL